MRSRILKGLRNPARYLPIAIKTLQQPLCRPFQEAPFYLQGQMDIHPKSRWHSREFTAAVGGFYPAEVDGKRRICNLEPWDNTRRDMLVLLLRTIVERDIPGEIAEIGV